MYNFRIKFVHGIYKSKKRKKRKDISIETTKDNASDHSIKNSNNLSSHKTFNRSISTICFTEVLINKILKRFCTLIHVQSIKNCKIRQLTKAQSELNKDTERGMQKFKKKGCHLFTSMKMFLSEELLHPKTESKNYGAIFNRSVDEKLDTMWLSNSTFCHEQK